MRTSGISNVPVALARFAGQHTARWEAVLLQDESVLRDVVRSALRSEVIDLGALLPPALELRDNTADGYVGGVVVQCGFCPGAYLSDTLFTSSTHGARVHSRRAVQEDELPH